MRNKQNGGGIESTFFISTGSPVKGRRTGTSFLSIHTPSSLPLLHSFLLRKCKKAILNSASEIHTRKSVLRKEKVCQRATIAENCQHFLALKYSIFEQMKNEFDLVRLKFIYMTAKHSPSFSTSNDE